MVTTKGHLKGDTSVMTKVGNIFKNLLLDESEYVVKRIANRLVVLESKDGERQILTGIENLGIRAFYQKKERVKFDTTA